MSDKYDEFTREELMQEIDILKKSKSYGIVWDKETVPEKTVKECEINLPVLIENSKKRIKTDPKKSNNIIIEGDNYHSLSVLNYTHKGRVDVIYIDPPYNTGKADEWKYNDRYVDENDGYRHSKWLNMMEKRLRLAKNLLKNNGVIFISIDDHEIAQLKMLCDNIFFEKNFIGQITREAIKGGSRSEHIRECHDFVLIYAKNREEVSFTGVEQDGFELELEDKRGKYTKGRELNKWGAGSRREDSPSMWFPIKGPDGKDVYPIRNDGSEGRWRWGKKKMQKAVEDQDLIFEKRTNGTYIVYEKIRDDSSRIKQFTTLFKDEYINAKGSETLKEIFGTSMSIFDYAKPVELIRDLILLSNMPKNGIVLDFFAGSGTTAHAVLELNKLDGGDRRFILCTNNEVGKKAEDEFCEINKITRGELDTWKKENRKEWGGWCEKHGICSVITYPRVEKIINGYKFIGKEKHVLFEKKIGLGQLYDSTKIMEEVEETIGKNDDKFDNIEKKFDRNNLSVIGIKNINSRKEGLGGNLIYFKTELVKKSSNRDQLKIDLTGKCTEMLCLKEGIFEVEKESKDYKIFTNLKRNKYLCIYYNFKDKSFDAFFKEIGKIKEIKKVYMFSLDNNIDEELFEDIENYQIEAIPEKILEIYKQLVKLSKR